MKLLAATNTGHSPRTDPEDTEPLAGELLLPAEQCDKPHCFCRREFVGVTSHSRTIHAQVVDLDITYEQVQAIARTYVTDLWPDLTGDDLDEEADAYARDIAEPAVELDVGTVVERWGHELRDIRDNTLDDDHD